MKYKFNDWSGPLEGFDKWRNSLYAAAKLEFGIDQDGDCPVDIKVIDRTKYWPDHYWLIPYDHRAKTASDLDKIEELLGRNLDQALEAYRKFREYRKRKAEDAVDRDNKRKL